MALLPVRPWLLGFPWLLDAHRISCLGYRWIHLSVVNSVLKMLAWGWWWRPLLAEQTQVALLSLAWDWWRPLPAVQWLL